MLSQDTLTDVVLVPDTTKPGTLAVFRSMYACAQGTGDIFLFNRSSRVVKRERWSVYVYSRMAAVAVCISCGSPDSLRV